MSSSTGSAWLFLQYNKHLSVIGEEVKNSFQNEACADAKIICDGGAINVHRLILASASPWLKTVFEEAGGDQHTIVIPDIKYDDMLLLVRFMYGGEVTVPLKQLGDLQDLIQLLQLDPGHVNGKFVIENTHDKSITANIPATITVVSPPTAQSHRGDDMDDDGDDEEGDGEERPDSPKPEDLSISSSEIRVKSEYSSKTLDSPMDMVTTDRSVTVSLTSGQRRSHEEAMGADDDVNVDDDDDLSEKAKIPETILTTTRTRGKLGGVSLGRHSTGSRRLLPTQTPGGSKRTRTSERFSLNIPLNNNLLLTNNNEQKEKKKKKPSIPAPVSPDDIGLSPDASDPLNMEDDGERGEEPSNNNSVNPSIHLPVLFFLSLSPFNFNQA